MNPNQYGQFPPSNQGFYSGNPQIGQIPQQMMYQQQFYPPQPQMYANMPGSFQPQMPPPAMYGQPMPMLTPQFPVNVTIGAPIVKGPSGPPPGWKPSITDASAFSNPNVRQPIQLYIGKIPSDIDDATFQKLLECCGRVQKWNRPIDATTNTHKAFGLVTYEFGINALRCLHVLTDLEINGAKLQIKAGTKEQAALDSIAEDEKSHDAIESIKVLENQIKENMLTILNIPRIVLSAIPIVKEPIVTNTVLDEGQVNNNAVSLPVVVNPISNDRQIPENFAQSEIEKFRFRQAQRDRELELQRLAKLKEKIQSIQKNKANENKTSTDQTTNKKTNTTTSQSSTIAPSIKIGNSSMDFIDNLLDSERSKFDADTRANGGFLSHDPSSNRRTREIDTVDPEQEEAKRRRKQQVLEMLGADFDKPTETNDKDKGVKVKLGSTLPSQTKKPSRFGNSNNLADDEDDSNKPVRTLIPIQYTDEERKEENLYKFESNYDDEAEDLYGKIKRYTGSAPDSSSKQTQSVAAQIAAAKAAEIAAKLKQPQQLTEDEKNKLRQKQLVDQIPTSLTELFKYKIDWNKIKDQSIISSVMKPWITKKVIEYLGEEEETLILFLLNKLDDCCQPDDLLVELSAVLEEDAEQFVIKLWRMLIFSMIRN